MLSVVLITSTFRQLFCWQPDVFSEGKMRWHLWENGREKKDFDQTSTLIFVAIVFLTRMVTHQRSVTCVHRCNRWLASNAHPSESCSPGMPRRHFSFAYLALPRAFSNFFTYYEIGVPGEMERLPFLMHWWWCLYVWRKRRWGSHGWQQKVRRNEWKTEMKERSLTTKQREWWWWKEVGKSCMWNKRRREWEIIVPIVETMK